MKGVSKKDLFAIRKAKLVLFFYIVLILFLCEVNAKNVSNKKQEKNIDIEILLSSDSDIYLEGLGGIQSVLNSSYRVRYLQLLTAKNTDFKKYFQKIEKENLKLYITVGLKASRLVRKYLKKTPLLFSHVHFPRALQMERGKICGFSLDISIKHSFKILKQINSKIKRVISFYSTESGKILASEGYAYDLQNGFIYSAKKVEANKFINVLESLKNKVDAIYMIPDLLYNKKNFKYLSEFCKRNHIILISPFRGLIEAGSVFGFVAENARIGIRAGHLANKIISNSEKKTSYSLCNGSVFFPQQLLFFLNESYAKSAGIKIPSSIRKKDIRMRLFYIGLRLLNSKKYKSAAAVFRKLISEDTTDKESSAMLQQIINITSEGKTKKLELLAAKARAKKNYSKANFYYKEILKINPNLFKIKNLLNTSIIEYSNYYASLAAKNKYHAKPFLAIMNYRKALNIYPANYLAQKELNQLRKSLEGNLTSLKQKGIQSYHSRNYKIAIDIFTNYLLIQPANKTILEYLRFSRKKMKAIKKLRELQ